MDLSNPWLLLSGVIIGLIGLVMFNHGRKEADLRSLGTGLVLLVYPYFISSLLVLWLVFAAIFGAIYAMDRMA